MIFQKLSVVYKKIILPLQKDWSFYKEIGINAQFVIAVIGMYLVTYALQGIGIGLILPLAKGILDGHFGFLETQFPFSAITHNIPLILSLSQIEIIALFIVFICLMIILKTIISYKVGTFISKKEMLFSLNASSFLFQKYLSFEKKFYDINTTGGVVSHVESFGRKVNGVINSFQTLIQVFIQLLIFLLLMAFVSVPLAIVALLIVPPFIIVNRKINKKIISNLKDIERTANSESAGVYSIFFRALLIKVSNKEDFEEKNFRDRVTLLEDKKFSAQKMQRLIAPINDIMIIILLLLFVGAILFIQGTTGKIGVAEGVFLLFLFNSFVNTAKSFTQSSFSMSQSIVNVAVILEKVEDPEEYLVSSGLVALPITSHKIEIKNLSFSFGKKEALKNLSCTFDSGKKTAIVGRNGSGKSTIFSLLLRLYDCPSGTIFIDENDIRDYSTKSIRDNISYITQEPILFQDTISNNIKYSVTNATDEEISKVIERAQLTEFVSEQPQKKDTNIGDRGARLSGGEKQKISIARALLKNAPLLLMDEATSSLDPKSEKEIQESINDSFSNKTCIFIAHRLSTVKHADKIIVIDKGKVAEEGTFDELMKKNGLFKSFVDAQKIV